MATFYRLLLAALLCFAANAVSARSEREAEIAECQPGEIVTWGDGVDRPSQARAYRIHYLHDQSPAWFGARQVEQLVERSARAWSSCGIPLSMVDENTSASATGPVIRVEWSEEGSRGNFGLANLTQRTLSLSPKAFTLLRTRNPAHDTTQTLQMVISHEMGHFLGLMAHSRRCADVLSYYHDGQGQQCRTRSGHVPGPGIEYRHHLPTACDLARCRQINRRPD